MPRLLPRHLALLLSAASLLAAGLAAAADTCSPQALRAAAAALQSPRSQLQAAAAAEDPDTDLAAPLRAALKRAKPAVAELVDAQLRCVPADRPPDLPALAAALATAANGDGDGGNTAANHAPGVSFEPALVAEAGWLAIVASLPIPCGSDAQLLLYAPQDGRWQRLLRWASADYARIDGAWESLQYRVAPRDSAGRRFVAVSHIRPWCSSTWSSIDYAVLRPVAGSDRPEVVLQDSDSLWWGNEDLGRLSVDARHFELRFHAASIDGGVHNREFIRRYDVGGTAPVRVTPVAANPRDFVDEWIVSEWAEARQWSAAPQDALQPRHAALHALRQRYAAFEFGRISGCTDAAGAQVELREAEDAAPLFFLVDGDTDYRLRRITTVPDPLCSKDLPRPD